MDGGQILRRPKGELKVRNWTQGTKTTLSGELAVIWEKKVKAHSSWSLMIEGYWERES